MALLLSGMSCGAAWAADDVVITNFEGENFGDWKVAGEAFGKGPARGPVGQQMPVDGFEGKGYCSSFHGGDAATGTLVSPPFKIDRKYLKFLIGGGGFAGKTCMNLFYQGKVVRTATGPNTQPGGGERLYRQSWDVSNLMGREVILELVDQATGGWGHLSVDQIALSDAPPESPQKELLKEADDYVESRAATAEKDPLRPIYHVMPKAQFTGDPNGPVFFNGEYHLFFQHMPFWGTAKQGIFWGHAVSKDMVHWQHLPIAMAPGPAPWDITGIASGGCVVRDGVPTIIYTGFSSQGNSQTECVATSADNLKTWTKDPANPVIPKQPNLEGLDPEGFRDPFAWREGNEWRLLVGAGFPGKGGTVLLYRSTDLRSWEFLGPLCKGMGDKCFMWECPTLFPLGDKHVLIVSPLFRDAPGLRGDTRYSVGTFRDNRFKPDEWKQVDLGGPGAYYAATTFEDPKKRRILWGMVMTPQGPNAGWANCISLPRVLTLGRDATLRYAPLPELESLRKEPRERGALALKKDAEVVLDNGLGLHAEVDIEIDMHSAEKVELRIGRAADGGGGFVPLSYDKTAGTLTFGDKKGELRLDAGEKLHVRLFIDGAVAEAFVNEKACFSRALSIAEQSTGLSVVASGGNAEVTSCRVWGMSSIW
jgi:sucrose-6-phosphate hydrolase SacC (GH32 family)